MYDLHIHSNFSNDCKYSMENMVKSAVDKNLKAIAFTEHVDFEYGGSKIDFVFNQSDYFKEIKRMKNNFKDTIEILSGIELGMQPHLVTRANDFMSKNDYDIVIMSVHTVKRLELYDGSFYKDKTPIQIYEDYYNDLLEILENFDNFDVIGHLNLVERYNYYLKEILDLNKYEELLMEVLKKIIEMGKGIEINTSGLRYEIQQLLPSRDIIEIYKKLGGEIVTIGSDAHNPNNICYGYPEVVSLLKELDFKYITIFRNRKKHFIKI